jgi:uncharacterized cupredoxin-like copper-binding protein
MYLLVQRGRTMSHLIGMLVLLLGVLAGCGTPATTTLNPPSEPGTDAVVEVRGGEFMFESTLTTFSVGTPYRFKVTNTGVVPHEWLIEKVEAEADEHSHTDHDDLIGAISVDELGPGMSATREVTFDSPGVYEFACRVPGHYEAGMKQTITVVN